MCADFNLISEKTKWIGRNFFKLDYFCAECRLYLIIFKKLLIFQLSRRRQFKRASCGMTDVEETLELTPMSFRWNDARVYSQSV